MHALVRRDVAMHDDPLRAQSMALAVGVVLAVLAVAGGFVFALVPRGACPRCVDRHRPRVGALYVRVGDTLHPVAQSSVGPPRRPRRRATRPRRAGRPIAAAKRGPPLGHTRRAGHHRDAAAPPSWTVCDDDRTVVAIGPDVLDESTTPGPCW